MNNIALIITGSIAAYKSLDLIRLFKKSGHEVSPIMTKAAAEFVTPLLVSSIAQSKVYDELFNKEEGKKMDHINLSRQNDAIIVAPASADFIAKMAGGLADDLASNVVLAANKPIFVAPAMNEKMWLNPKTQENLQILRQNGVRILAPQTDILACGEYGVGKMVDPEEIFAKVEDFLNQKQILAGKKVIVSAGATFEPIDPVRFIGNYSSGKQGIKIAEEMADAGADVVLVLGNSKEIVNLPAKNIKKVKTAEQMLCAIEENIENADIFVSCAAVADFKPKKAAANKIKKADLANNLQLELEENIDILKTISSGSKRPKIVVGFAAESENLLKNGQKKLKEKNCDLILANNIENGAVFGSEDNQIIAICQNGSEKWPKMSKRAVARKLIERLVGLL
jgi:phosphopantothenoylcysteine decarboxylase / phosphopantothenate---cysteine ligase